MATSTDGKTWTAVANSKFGSSNINAIAHGSMVFAGGAHDSTVFAGGESGILTHMITISQWERSITVDGNIYAIAYGNNFVVGGSRGEIHTTTTNFSTWVSKPYSKFGASDIYAITFGKGRFVAGGENGKMATSTDGITWTAVADSTFGTESIYAIAYGSNTFVAVGDNGKIAYCQPGN